MPGLENRVFAAAIYPDGSPAAVRRQVLGRQGEPRASRWPRVKTNEAGLAEFQVTPKAEQFRPGEWAQQNIEMLGGRPGLAVASRSCFDLLRRGQGRQGQHRPDGGRS